MDDSTCRGGGCFEIGVMEEIVVLGAEKSLLSVEAFNAMIPRITMHGPYWVTSKGAQPNLQQWQRARASDNPAPPHFES
jgi:hypothetical protein